MPNELNLPSLLNDDVYAFSVSVGNISEKLHVGRPLAEFPSSGKIVSVNLFQLVRTIGEKVRYIFFIEKPCCVWQNFNMFIILERYSNM